MKSHKNRMKVLLASHKNKKMTFDGTMVALIAPQSVVKKAKKEGLLDKNLDLLHITLVYLGVVSNDELKSIQKSVERVCSKHEPILMSINGAGKFIKGEDGTPVYLVPNGKGLSLLQADLENAISNIIELPSKFGWVPHMTISYSKEENPKIPDISNFPKWKADTVRIQSKAKKIADIKIGKPMKKKALNKIVTAKLWQLPKDPPVRWNDEVLVEVATDPELKQKAIEKGIWETKGDRLGIKELIKIRGLTDKVTPILKLPINLDPVTWDNLQLINVLQHKELQDQATKAGILEKVIEELKKRKIIQIREVNNAPNGEQVENDQGWFLLQVEGKIIGFVKGKNSAQLVINKILDDVEKGDSQHFSSLNIGNSIFLDVRKFVKKYSKEISGNLYTTSRIRWLFESIGLDRDKLGEDFVKSPLYGKVRKKYVESTVDIIKSPIEPNPKSIITGNDSTNDIENNTYNDIYNTTINSEGDYRELSKKGNEFLDRMKLNIEKEEKNKKKLIEELTKPIIKKIKYAIDYNKETGEYLEPGQMVDDLDMLPITNNPVMWSTDQIISILKNKELMDEVKADDELFKKFVKEIQDRKIDLKKVFQKLDIGDWREHGYFILNDAIKPILGVYTSKEQANLAYKTLIDNMTDKCEDIGAQMLISNLADLGISQNRIYDYEINNKEVEEEVEKLKSHPLYKKKRRELAEKRYSVIKASSDIVFSKDSIVPSSQNLPDEKNRKSAIHDVTNQEFFKDLAFDKIKKFQKDLKEFYKDSAEKIKKRLDLRDEGIDPDQMADDIKISSLNRILRIAILTTSKQELNRLSNQLDLYIKRNAEIKQPLKRNFDYGYSPWNGSVSEFMKKFPNGLKDFLKWNNKKQILTKEKEKLNKDAINDSKIALKAINLLKAAWTKKSHFIPDGGDDVSKMGDKEPKLWSGNQQNDIKEFLNKYRKHYERDADDIDFALDAAKDFVKYWSLLLKKPKRKKRSK